jgi:hypothetical protein
MSFPVFVKSPLSIRCLYIGPLTVVLLSKLHFLPKFVRCERFKPDNLRRHECSFVVFPFQASFALINKWSKRRPHKFSVLPLGTALRVASKAHGLMCSKYGCTALCAASTGARPYVQQVQVHGLCAAGTVAQRLL